MTKILIQAIILLLLSTAFIGFGGILGQYGLEKWTEFRSYLRYNYRYFKGYPINHTSKRPEDVRVFLNSLDKGKRKADEDIEKITKDAKTSARLRKINDYTFRIFRDFWFIQNEWLRRNGRYFQGLDTMPTPPCYNGDSKVMLDSGLSDQVDHWRDIGYEEDYAPVQLECYIYEKPKIKKDGFLIWARFTHLGKIWQCQMHVGPDTHYDKDNYIWSSKNEFPKK